MKADPRTPPEFAQLPKWLVAPTPGPGKSTSGHIVHCHFPRFIMTVDPEKGSGLPLWLDKPSAAGPSAGDTALVLEATDFFNESVARSA